MRDRCGRRRTSPCARRANGTTRSSRRIASRFTGATTASRRAPRSRSCPTMPPRSAESRCSTTATPRGRSRSRATARWCSRSRERIASTPPSRTSSWRRSGTNGVPRSPRRGAPGPPRKPGSGACTSWTAAAASAWAGPASRRTARDSSAAAVRRATPDALEHDGALSGSIGAVLDPICRHPRARASRSRPVGVGRVHDARGGQRQARRSRLPIGITTPTPRSAPSISRGPPRRWSCASWACLRRTPPCSRSWRGISSIRIRSCARRMPRCGANTGAQPLLWSQGISGDWPILLARIRTADGIPTIAQLFAAHHYWRRHGMMVDS